MFKTGAAKAIPYLVLVIALLCTAIAAEYTLTHVGQLRELLPRSNDELISFEIVLLALGISISLALFLILRSHEQATTAAESTASDLRASEENQLQLNTQLEQYRTKLKELISQ